MLDILNSVLTLTFKLPAHQTRRCDGNAVSRMKPPVAVNASADDFQMTVTLVLWPVAAVHIHKLVNHTIRAAVTTLMLIKRYNNDVRFIHTISAVVGKIVGQQFQQFYDLLFY